MAIIPSLPGIEVFICVNGVPLPEYEEDEDDDSGALRDGLEAHASIVKYIESTAEQEFSLKYTVAAPYKMSQPTLTFRYMIDGNTIGSRVLTKHGYERVEKFTHSSYGQKASQINGEGTIRHYKFSKIETSLNDDALEKIKEDTARISKSGEIIIDIFRGGISQLVPRKEGNPNHRASRNAEVHEKALKGQAKYHSFSFGQAQPHHIPPVSKKATGLESRPMARYIFKYRSRNALQQLLIIPRTPSPGILTPSQHTGSLDLGGLDPDQLTKVQQLVRHLKGDGSQPSGPTKVKHELNEAESTSNKRPRVKRERITIDLTADSSDDAIEILH